MKLKRARLILSLGVLASPVAAQDGSEAAAKRTPASAQRFLSSELPDWIHYDSVKQRMQKVTAVTSPDVCRTTYAVTVTMLQWQDETTGQLREAYAAGSVAKWIPDPTKSLITKTVDWSKVRSVVVSETVLDGQKPILIYAPNAPESAMTQTYVTPDVRDRVTAAMKFLQTSCDSTAETGF